MTSDIEQLRIANIIYANVSSDFALLCNKDMVGINFKWSKFSDMMVNRSADWIWIHDTSLKSPVNDELAKQYAREIADRLVSLSGFLDEEPK